MKERETSSRPPGSGWTTRRAHDQVDISERLVISPKTVATHIQHILEKLGVHSRQAVAVAHRYGVGSLAS